MSTVSAVVLWRAFILLHIALHCYLFFPGFVRGKQNSRQRLLELTHPIEQFREWILKQVSCATHHLPEAVDFCVAAACMELIHWQYCDAGARLIWGWCACLSTLWNYEQTQGQLYEHWSLAVLAQHTTHSHSESFQLAFPSLTLSSMASTFIIN